MTIFELFPDLPELKRSGFEHLRATRPVVMIAMTARTGSTNFCANFASRCNVGQPTEIFNPRGVAQQLKADRKAETFLDYFGSFDAEPGEVLAFKTSWNDFVPFADCHRQLFPGMRILYLQRRDIIAQAVSLFRAQITNIWHVASADSVSPGIPTESLKAQFDLPRIVEILRNLEAEKNAWEDFFADQKLDVLRLVYEHFSADFAGAIAQAAQYLGLSLHRTAAREHTGFRKLSDAVSEDWIHRVRCHVLRLT